MRIRSFINGIMELFTYLLIILFLIMITEATAQQSPKNKYFQMKVRTKQGSVKKGYLVRMQDSVIYLNESPYGRRPFDIKTDQIESIRIHRKGGTWKGMAIGASSGALLGYIIGYATYQEPSVDFGPQYSGFGGMSIGLLLGGGIGALAGGASKTFKINGDQNSFELIKPELSKYQLLYDPLVDVK